MALAWENFVTCSLYLKVVPNNEFLSPAPQVLLASRLLMHWDCQRGTQDEIPTAQHSVENVLKQTVNQS